MLRTATERKLVAQCTRKQKTGEQGSSVSIINGKWTTPDTRCDITTLKSLSLKIKALHLKRQFKQLDVAKGKESYIHRMIQFVYMYACTQRSQQIHSGFISSWKGTTDFSIN